MRPADARRIQERFSLEACRRTIERFFDAT